MAKRAWLVGLALAAVALGGLSWAGGQWAGERVNYVPSEAVVIHQGDTLWSIAQSVTAPGKDVRETLQLIRDLNGLDDSLLMAGDQLWVPRLRLAE